MELPKIGVFPADEWASRQPIFEALSLLFDVQFVAVDWGALDSCKHAFLFGGTREEASALAAKGVRILCFPKGKSTPLADPSAPVKLDGEGVLGRILKDRCFPDDSLTSTCPLIAQAGDITLATKAGELLWIRTAGQHPPVDWVGSALPEMQSGDYLFDWFHHGNWMQLLPVLAFLKEVSPWTPPPLRAAIMFDDPNLHWPTYGYVDYRELAHHAETHRYHAAFATVPVDAWLVNPSAASIFREHPDRLSFLIHGNNHTTCELTSIKDEEQQLALAAQAIQRIKSLEKKSGIPIPRVMAAPHGACSPEMAGALLRLGFDAACISRGSIMSRNPGRTWPSTIGLSITEFMGGGLPILPRFNMRLEKGAEFSALLAAFLGQPIIPVGHHDDLSRGLGIMSRLADFINSMGEVAWKDMRAIAETNFATCLQDGLLTIKMYARRVRLRVPEGVTRLQVVLAWNLSPEGDPNEGFRIEQDGLSRNFSVASETPVCPGHDLIVESNPVCELDPCSVPLPRTPLWARVRRHLCEVRDRLRPLKGRFSKR